MLLSFIFFGITVTLAGSVLPRILRDFHWSYAETGLVLASGALGNFISTLIVGILINRFGLRIIMLSSLLVIGAGNLIFGLFSAVLFNLAVFLFIGIGQGALEVTVNTSVVRMERKDESHLMSFMHASFSSGAVIGPLLAGALLAAGGAWQLTFRSMGLLFLVSAVIPVFLPFGRITEKQTPPLQKNNELPAGQTRSTVKKHRSFSLDWGKGVTPVVLLGTLTIFLYIGVEMGISNWISEYFVKRFSVTASKASLIVALFWGGILFGRIVIPLLAKSISLTRQLIILTSFSAVAVLLILLLPGFLLAGLGTLLAGLGCSAIYPLVMSLIGKYITRNQSIGLSIVSMGGGIGSFSFPFLLAIISQNLGLITGFGFLAIMGGLLIFSSVLLYFRVQTITYDVQ